MCFEECVYGSLVRRVTNVITHPLPSENIIDHRCYLATISNHPWSCQWKGQTMLEVPGVESHKAELSDFEEV